MILSDGTVIPSCLTQDNETFNRSLNNNSVMVGTISKIYQSDSDNKFIHYDVNVEVRDEYNISTAITLTNVRVMSLFGGKADYVRWQPREMANKKTDIQDVGSRVLVIAVNGNLRDALIIGGYPHPASEQELDEGHCYKSEFNGINVNINNDGDLTVERKSATNANGEVTGENGGAKVVLDKNGSILTSSSKGNKSELNDDSDTIESHANGDHNIDAGGNVSITSSGVLAGGSMALDYWVKGTTYRIAETTLHTTMVAQLTILSTLIASASASINAAAQVLLKPAVPPAVAASGAPFQAAGASLAGVAPIITALITSINTFEAGAANYLSKKNKTD